MTTSGARVSLPTSTVGRVCRPRYRLVEAPAFLASAARIGEIRRLDEALEALTWALSFDPHQFPTVHGFDRLRVARTALYQWADGWIAPLRVFFAIDDSDLHVDLLALDVLPIAELEPPP